MRKDWYIFAAFIAGFLIGGFTLWAEISFVHTVFNCLPK